jgi:hypothetical protein
MPKPPIGLHDILTFRKGGGLNTEVLNKTFTIKTDFGNTTAKKSDIVRITMEGRGLPDEMIVNPGNILKGKIQDKTLSAIIFSGEVKKFRLPKDILATQFLDNLHPTVSKIASGRSRRRKNG